MAIGIAILILALAVTAVRVMPRARPNVVESTEPRFAPPPVTMEVPALSPALVPPIDRAVLAALLAGGSRGVANVLRPARLARGSMPPACAEIDRDRDDLATDLDESAATLRGDDLDDSAATLRGSDLDVETLRPAHDLDDAAVTRADMQPVT